LYDFAKCIPACHLSTGVLQKDPFLELSEESTLNASSSAVFAGDYGTQSDDNAALSSLSRISLLGDLSNEALVARIVEASPTLVEVIRQTLL
jgi:hypothetical protein